MLHRLNSRIQRTGIWKTTGYVLFTVLLGRVGFHWNHVFQRRIDCGRPPAMPAGFAAGSVRQMCELTERDRAALLKYGGEKLATQFGSAFLAGKVCIAVHSPDGDLAAVCWAGKMTAFEPWTAVPCVVVDRCFTLPRFRGLGLFPAALSTVDQAIPEDMRNFENIFIECSVCNHSSKKAILKAGFRIVGSAIEVGRKRIGWLKKSS